MLLCATCGFLVGFWFGILVGCGLLDYLVGFPALLGFLWFAVIRFCGFELFWLCLAAWVLFWW